MQQIRLVFLLFQTGILTVLDKCNQTGILTVLDNCNQTGILTVLDKCNQTCILTVLDNCNQTQVFSLFWIANGFMGSNLGQFSQYVGGPS